MEGRMSGRVDEWVEGRTRGHVDEWIEGWMDVRMDRRNR